MSKEKNDTFFRASTDVNAVAQMRKLAGIAIKKRVLKEQLDALDAESKGLMALALENVNEGEGIVDETFGKLRYMAARAPALNAKKLRKYIAKEMGVESQREMDRIIGNLSNAKGKPFAQFFLKKDA